MAAEDRKLSAGTVLAGTLLPGMNFYGVPAGGANPWGQMPGSVIANYMYFGGSLYPIASVSDGEFLKRSGGTIVGGTATVTPPKGFAFLFTNSVPSTLGAPFLPLADGSSPVTNIWYFEFADSALAYRDFGGVLLGYNGGGLTVSFEVLRTTASAAAGYYFQAAIRRLQVGSDDVSAAHTYDYNSVTVTVPAGPPAAGIPMQGTITFTDGADMDSLANNEKFILRFRRDPTNGADNAGDTARVLALITVRET